MKAWATTTVTRAEAIGFALAVPVLWSVFGTALTLTALFGDKVAGTRAHPELVTPALSVFLGVGATGCVVLIALCGLCTLLALLTRQRGWVRVAAPLACWLLTQALYWQVAASFRDYDTASRMMARDDARARPASQADGSDEPRDAREPDAPDAPEPAPAPR